jgi:hypothetical protein
MTAYLVEVSALVVGHVPVDADDEADALAQVDALELDAVAPFLIPDGFAVRRVFLVSELRARDGGPK